MKQQRIPQIPEKEKCQTLYCNISPGHGLLSNKKKDRLAVNFVPVFSPSLHLQQSQTNLALGQLRLQRGKNGQREISYFLSMEIG